MKDPFKNQLVYEHALPVKWEPFVPGSSSLSITEINNSNENFLRMLLSIDETKKEIDDNSEYAQEFQRIDAKLNIVMQWLGQWIAETQGVPEVAQIKMSESGIAISGSTPVEIGASMLFQVHLSRSYPQPLYLPGKVLSVENGQTGSTIVAEFVGLTAEVCNLIEKFIFREHRRGIAANKRQIQAEEA